MFEKLNTVLRRRAHPFVILASGLVLLVLLTSLTGMWHYQYELDHLSRPGSPALAATKTSSDAKNDNPRQAGVRNVTSADGQNGAANPAGPNTAGPGIAGYSSARPAGVNSTSGPNNTSAPSAVAVSLSVNGSYKGKVVLSSSASQCDVLSQALKDGFISSLDMRYNSQYKSYGVYVIDGMGDSNSVWWTYQVNGKSPPYGCSYTAVHAGDSANWQYIR